MGIHHWSRPSPSTSAATTGERAVENQGCHWRTSASPSVVSTLALSSARLLAPVFA